MLTGQLGSQLKKSGEKVMLDIMSNVMVFRYGKFSGFLKQKPFIRADVFMNIWLWK